MVVLDEGCELTAPLDGVVVEPSASRGCVVRSPAVSLYLWFSEVLVATAGVFDVRSDVGFEDVAERDDETSGTDVAGAALVTCNLLEPPRPVVNGGEISGSVER